jgi:hypothetical protein
MYPDNQIHLAPLWGCPCAKKALFTRCATNTAAAVICSGLSLFCYHVRQSVRGANAE